MSVTCPECGRQFVRVPYLARHLYGSHLWTYQEWRDFVKGGQKNPHAVALGRLGGRRGGKARRDALTPEDRPQRSPSALA